MASSAAAPRLGTAVERERLVGSDALPGKAPTASKDANRLIFVFRVYGLLALQNALVLMFALCCFLIRPLAAYIAGNIWVPITAGVVFAGVAAPLFLLRDRAELKKTPLSAVAFVVFCVLEMFVAGTIIATFNTSTLVYFFGTSAVALGTSSIFALQNRLSFSALIGIALTTLCGLIVVGILSAVIGLPLSGFIWGTVAAVVYCSVVVIHGEFTMSAIVDSKATNPPHAMLARVDGWAAALKVSLDLLVIFPFLYGVIRAVRGCCGGSQGKAE